MDQPRHGRLQRDDIQDGVLAIALVALGGLSMVSGLGLSGAGGGRAADWSYVPLLLCIALPVAFRRRSPLAAWLTTAAGALIAFAVFRFPIGFEYLASPIGMYTVGVYGTRVEVAIVAGLASIQVAISLWEYTAAFGVRQVFSVSGLAVMLGLGIVPLLAGLDVRRRRHEAAVLRDANARLERLAVLEARQAAAAERARIARDLHDSVAHSLSGIVVQAGAGKRVFEAAPDEARASLGRIQESGSRALAEMRRLVGLMRAGDEDVAPNPTIGEIAVLVSEARQDGLSAELHVEGEPRTVSDAVEISAYRIVQEALTNARRHAAAESASVLVRFLPDQVEVEVTNDGPVVNGVDRSGNGLVGMRERAELCGGAVDVGPRDGGGWRVHATLPAR